MISRSGLDRNKRNLASDKGQNLSIMDISMSSLQEQAISISGLLTYYNINNQPEGYIDSLIKQIKIDKEDGHLNPAAALIQIFLENLQLSALSFNNQWRNYPKWYLKEILKVEYLKNRGNKIWIGLQKTPNEKVIINEGTRFVTQNDSGQKLYYITKETIEIPDTYLVKACIINLNKDKYKEPERDLNLVSSVNIRDLVTKPDLIKQKNIDFKSIGIKLTSPALLLREGQRSVSMTFYSKNDWIGKFTEIVKEIISKKDEQVFQSLSYDIKFSNQIFKNIFYLSISTSEGWTQIANYTVQRDKISGGFELKFTLDEKFPPTEGCTVEKHKFKCKYPKINIHLNFDSWMYPYSWIKNIIIDHVKINTKVQNVSNLKVYNELGKIDISTPFPPFGINNRKGNWMAIGNYELAVKNTNKINIDIRWGQLPEDKEGLFDYYKEYFQDINNASFKVSSHYLADYEWKKTENSPNSFYLFSTDHGESNNRPLEKSPLCYKTHIQGIEIGKMPQIKSNNEEEYEYNQQARSGFISFSLKSPDMGFGNNLYYKLFSEQLIRNSKKGKLPTINPPINPLVDRITLSYEAEDFIDFQSSDNDSSIDYILPFDTLDYFPLTKKQSIPFVLELDNTNLLIALKRTESNKELNIYFEFISEQKEIASYSHHPIQWYIGNMRNWKEISEASLISKDETMRLSVSGRICFKIPSNLSPELFDNDGYLWIRAGIKYDDSKIKNIKSLTLNPILLELDDETLNQGIPFNSATTNLEPEKKIPGLIDHYPLTTFFGGREQETDKEMMIRVSEHITHQGRAVTPRDYERLILQEFLDIGKVLCYKELDQESNVITSIAVLPAIYANTPLVSNYTMMKVEKYLQNLSTSRITRIKITNPLYEQVLVRLVMKQDESKQFFSRKNLQIIENLINRYIAPWRQKKELPKFGHVIPIHSMYAVVKKALKKKGIILHSFKIFCFMNESEHYTIDNYSEDEEKYIALKYPNMIFVPASEHLLYMDFENEDITPQFGINEMKLDDTFIISKNNI